MNAEIESLLVNNTYELVPPPPDCKIIGGRWVYSIKRDSQNNIKFKSRYVAQGYTQSKGINYDTTYAPTAHLVSIRMIVNMAVQEGYILHQLDVNNAYLNSDVDYILYMSQPQGFIKNPNLVCKLNKSIYGLKQSAFLWNENLLNFMLNENLTQSIKDPCVFIRNQPNNTLLVLIWVDDIILCGSSDEVIATFKTNFGKRYKIKDLGILSWFLGIQFSISERVISMNQSLYVKNILERFGMEHCAPMSNPCDGSIYTLLKMDSKPLEK